MNRLLLARSANLRSSPARPRVGVTRHPTRGAAPSGGRLGAPTFGYPDFEYASNMFFVSELLGPHIEDMMGL